MLSEIALSCSRRCCCRRHIESVDLHFYGATVAVASWFGAVLGTHQTTGAFDSARPPELNLAPIWLAACKMNYRPIQLEMGNISVLVPHLAYVLDANFGVWPCVSSAEEHSPKNAFGGFCFVWRPLEGTPELDGCFFRSVTPLKQM